MKSRLTFGLSFVLLLCLAASVQAADLVARAGTTITLDVANLSSEHVKVLLDDKELFETPILGSNVGLKIPIPATETNGSHQLTVRGVEQGEEITQDLVVIDGASPLDLRIWLGLAGALFLGLLLALLWRKRNRIHSSLSKTMR